MSARVLDVANVSVRFFGLRALDDVSLAVGEREIVSLIGPNGAGKTTLLNAVCGLVPTAGGHIAFRQGSLARARLPQLRALGIARTFQHAKLLDELSVLDNVVLGAHASRAAWRLAAECLRLPAGRRELAAHAGKAMALLRQFSLDDVAGAPAGALPFGKKKLVDIARALISEPSLMLLDEPTAGLNDAEVQHLGRLLLSLRARMSMLIVAHHMGFVAEVADRVLCLDGGTKIAEGTPAQVQADPAVVQAYLGKD